MKITLTAIGAGLVFGFWAGALGAVDFDVHNAENGYASDSVLTTNANVGTGESHFVGLPGEDYSERLEVAEIAAMEIREVSPLPEITFLPGWDPELSEIN